MNKLMLNDVSRQYGNQQVLKNINLHVAAGEFVTLLGPSGSGKSTLLKIVAGMVRPSSGSVIIDGRDTTQTDPRKRDLGMVFQNYALMPHMSVFENVAFPLRVRKESAAAIARKVHDALSKVQLEHLAKRFPAALSGGQQQRVAIARAIVYNPSLVLMDEPLGALDKNLREQLQFEIKELHRELGITVLYVTHDQTEAMAMSDRVVLMNNGAAEQVALPETLYFKPASHFTARFLGESNFIKGCITLAPAPVFRVDDTGEQFDLAQSPELAEGAATLMTRPEYIQFARAECSGTCAYLKATAVSRTFLGSTTSYLFRRANGEHVKAIRLNDGNDDDFHPGLDYYLSWNTRQNVFISK